MTYVIPEDRRHRILELLKEQGVVRVLDLSQQFEVSVLTIRRDLDLLEKKGLLERSHGGAVLRQSMQEEPLFTQKQQRHTSQKQSIAGKAAEMVSDGDVVFINSGSTTLEVIRLLLHKRITIITNNIAAAVLADTGSCDVLLLGGTYRSQSQSVSGDFALQQLNRLYANKAVIGVDGVSVKKGLTTPIMQEAETGRAMMEQTLGQIIVVADSRKIGVVSTFKTADIRDIDVLITDAGGSGFLDDEELRRVGVTLITAD